MALPPCVSPLRVCLLVSGVIGASALAACTDHQPTGVDSSAAPSATVSQTSCSLPGPWKFIFKSNQQITAQGLTAFILNPSTGRRVTREVDANNEAIFTFTAEDGLCADDRVIGGLDNLRYSRLQQQLQNGSAFYAPFDNVEYTADPSPEPRIISLYYTAGVGNNWIAKTVENLDAIAANENHGSWFRLPPTSSSASSQPISVLPANYTSLSGEVRITRIVDTNGQTVATQGNLYGVSQIITPTQAPNYFAKYGKVPCDPHVKGTETFVAWYCSLPSTLFTMETVVNRATRVPPGSYVIAVKLPDHPTGKKTGIRAGTVSAGGTDDGEMLSVNTVRFSYDFAPGQSQLTYARGGFEGDETTLAGSMQAYWSQAAVGTIKVTFVENPGQKGGKKTTVVELECGTAIAPTSCVQVSKGKTYPHFGMFNQTKGEGSGVVSVPQGSTTTTACIRIELNGIAQPLYSPDPLTPCPEGSNLMDASKGRGGTFKLM